MNERKTPFVTLGRHLQRVRERASQSLAEVCGAVEIDEEALQRIEAGEERPPEDILLLLISHFGVHDQEALRLWELANYDSEFPDQLKFGQESHSGDKSIVMLLALDTRALYSDGVDIVANQAGLNMTFTQSSQDQSMPVARVGMSYEQAAQVLLVLQRTLLQAKYLKGPKLLPPPDSAKSQ